MKEDMLDVKMEIEKLFKAKSLSFIKATIRRTKLNLFFYQDSTIFFIQFGFFMIPFAVKLANAGPLVSTFLIGLVCSILYYPFYKFVLKKYVFEDSNEIRLEAERKLKAIYWYIERRNNE